MGSMVMNMAANMLGLANAATPLGLRAMQHLEKLNPRPGVATNAMCVLAINTSSFNSSRLRPWESSPRRVQLTRPPSSERLSWRPSAQRQPESQPLRPSKSCPILRCRNWKRKEEPPSPNETSIEEVVTAPLSAGWKVHLCWRFASSARCSSRWLSFRTRSKILRTL